MSLSNLPLVILVPFLCMITACKEAEIPQQREIVQPAKVMTIGSGDSELTRRFPGSVRAAQRVELSFQVSGQLVHFPVKNGQNINKGDVLGRLDKRDYQSNLDAATAQRVKMKSNFDRAKDLIKKKFISQADYDRILADYNIAQSEVEKYQKALEDTDLVAPFSGTIARTYVENFQDVPAKQAVLSLQDNSALEVVVNVAESIIARRQESDQLSIVATFDSMPNKEFPVTVKEFATEADPQTQTYQYILGLEGIEGENLLPGMTASLKVTRKTSNTADDAFFVLPMAALTEDQSGNTSVWTVDSNDLVHSQIVSTGDMMGTGNIQVLSGLNTGDRVVIAGVQAMREGRKIKPVEEVSF